MGKVEHHKYSENAFKLHFFPFKYLMRLKQYIFSQKKKNCDVTLRQKKRTHYQQQQHHHHQQQKRQQLTTNNKRLRKS